MSENATDFIKRQTRKHRTPLLGGSIGLSGAAVAWIFFTFATGKDLDKVRQSQSSQWQAIQRQQAEVTALRLEVAEVRAQNRAYDVLILMINRNRNNQTN